jgi:hypothetical protein
MTTPAYLGEEPGFYKGPPREHDGGEVRAGHNALVVLREGHYVAVAD